MFQDQHVYSESGIKLWRLMCKPLHYPDPSAIQIQGHQTQIPGQFKISRLKCFFPENPPLFSRNLASFVHWRQPILSYVLLVYWVFIFYLKIKCENPIFFTDSLKRTDDAKDAEQKSTDSHKALQERDF